MNNYKILRPLSSSFGVICFLVEERQTILFAIMSLSFKITAQTAVILILK